MQAPDSSVSINSSGPSVLKHSMHDLAGCIKQYFGGCAWPDLNAVHTHNFHCAVRFIVALAEKLPGRTEAKGKVQLGTNIPAGMFTS